MHCPSCAALVATDSVFPGGTVLCACGASVVVPLAGAVTTTPATTTTESSQADAPCPRCGAPLVIRDEEGIVVTVCPASHGAFVAHRVLAKLTEQSRGAAHALDSGEPASTLADAAPLPCPRCKDPMLRRELSRGSGIVVDVCAAHGTWFDAGELRAAAIARPAAIPATEAADLEKRAAATLDVALALEQARDDATARRAFDLTEDVLDTINLWVLGRTRVTRRYR